MESGIPLTIVIRNPSSIIQKSGFQYWNSGIQVCYGLLNIKRYLTTAFYQNNPKSLSLYNSLLLVVERVAQIEALGALADMSLVEQCKKHFSPIFCCMVLTQQRLVGYCKERKENGDMVAHARIPIYPRPSSP